MENRPGILSDKERKRIDNQLEKKKEAQMDRTKKAYDKTFKKVMDVQNKHNLTEDR